MAASLDGGERRDWGGVLRNLRRRKWKKCPREGEIAAKSRSQGGNLEDPGRPGYTPVGPNDLGAGGEENTLFKGRALITEGQTKTQ